MTLEVYERFMKITRIGNRAVRKAQEETGEKGFPMFMPIMVCHIGNCLTKIILSIVKYTKWHEKRKAGQVARRLGFHFV
jgi:hypothetical protein